MSKSFATKKLKIPKLTVTIALVVLLAFAATFMSLSVVHAAIPQEETNVFMSVAPNPVGVGQTVTVGVWIYPIPPNQDLRYHNISVTIWHPDGTTERLGPVTGAALGNWVWTYVPPVTGTFQFQASHPTETYYNVAPTFMSVGGPYNVTRLGSMSPKVNLTVQQQPVEPLPQTPLPTEYWTYPINAQNYQWAGISGNWLGGGFGSSYNTSSTWNPYTTGPKTAHVMWKYPIAFGGIVGAPYDSWSYASGTMYEGKMGPALVIGGRFYQYEIGDRNIGNTLDCIDLATGEVLWRRNISVSIAQLYKYESVNQVGVHAYLWSTGGFYFGFGPPPTWEMYDAYNGNHILSLSNVSSGGTIVQTDDGNMLDYVFNAPAGWMAMWNFTKCMDENGLIQYQSVTEHQQFGIYAGMFRPSSGTYNWKKGIQWNVTIPKEPLLSGFGSSLTLSAPGGIGVSKTAIGNNKQIIFGYSVSNNNPRKLWGPVNLTSTVQSALAVGAGCAVLGNPTDMKFYAYDLNTGNLKWASDPGTYPWGSVTCLSPRIAYNKLIATSYDKIHAYDMNTGKEVWSFYTGNSGVETPYGTWIPNALGSAIAGGGFIYFDTGAWHPNNAYVRGDRMFCLDQATGKMIWNMTGFWFTNGLIANGYLVALNEYDECMYAWNKGPSKTTVSVSMSPVADGSSTVILGTVTDQTPGSKDTPAISDQWMTPWMEYLYEQQPKPTSATGVPVYLQAYRVDDKSMIDIGSTYSDINGHYEYLWTPPTTGTYKILASFPGSDSYYMSSAETALGVVAAPPAAEPVEIPAYPDYTPLFTGIIVAVVIAIVIGIVNLLWKRK